MSRGEGLAGLSGSRGTWRTCCWAGPSEMGAWSAVDRGGTGAKSRSRSQRTSVQLGGWRQDLGARKQIGLMRAQCSKKRRSKNPNGGADGGIQILKPNNS